MNLFRVSLLLMLVVAVQPVAPQAMTTPGQQKGLTGRWRVKFSLSGVGEKNLELESRPDGSGSFLLLDTGPGDKPVEAALPAAWSQTTDDRINFSGEVELPLGTCCREVGTLIFKGKFTSGNSISGKAIFIGATVDEENFNGFRSTTGAFTATRILRK